MKNPVKPLRVENIVPAYKSFISFTQIAFFGGGKTTQTKCDSCVRFDGLICALSFHCCITSE